MASRVEYEIRQRPSLPGRWVITRKTDEIWWDTLRGDYATKEEAENALLKIRKSLTIKIDFDA